MKIFVLFIAFLTWNEVKVTSFIIGRGENSTFESFKTKRDIWKEKEFSMSLGYNLQLSPLEELANGIIKKYKADEINEGFFERTKFVPSLKFADSLKHYENSKLYKLIKSMPKAGILHAHDTALGSTKILIDLTYKENCWICVHEDGSLRFLFSRNEPNGKYNCDKWELMANYRLKGGMSDKEIVEKITLNSKHHEHSQQKVWKKFESLFGVNGGLISYIGNYEEYLRRTLQELLLDGVQYVELRTSLRGLYDLDGNYSSRYETAEITRRTINKFVEENPSFIGAKIIFSRYRRSDSKTVEQYLADVSDLKPKFSDILCGFDLVGREDSGYPLDDFLPALVEASNSMDYFFHAGETNWNGLSTDENLFDAVMLNSKRIGHAYALTKHPLLANKVKEKDICLEINPLSNQILKLVDDLTNHPAAYFLANNFPMVVSSDDPGYWGAAPLSDDFYVTFLGIASAQADLRMLKQLAANSIKYSCMEPEMKEVAYSKWNTTWNSWIQNIIATNNLS